MQYCSVGTRGNFHLLLHRAIEVTDEKLCALLSVDTICVTS